MKLFTVLACALLPLLASASAPTKTVKRTPSPQFVQTEGTKFMVNGSEFQFIGTNVYWLQALNTEQDIINTFSNISALGINVVRTWAFNDVTAIPEDNGTWFQLILNNGTTVINNGTNGLQKLDFIVEQAERFGIYLILTLTNNWNPAPTDNLTNSIASLQSSIESRTTVDPLNVTVDPFNATRPRNFLSNDYGGMDVYVRQFNHTTHDQFFTNDTLISTFLNYTTAIVTRYVNSTSVFSWELANDPRCNSSINASPGCVTQNITTWHNITATHITGLDGNHLVSSGAQGFMCMNCTKIFATPTPTPRPSPRAAAGRRAVAKPFTEARLLQERNERWKQNRALLPKSEEEGIRVRGRWVATPTRRQSDSSSQSLGSAFDGSQGVDSQDILAIPNLGFGSFQLFPDQNSYGPNDPSLSAFNNTVQNGIEWIKTQANLSVTQDKPVSLIGFGLVTQTNAPDFVPFNSTIAPFANTTASTAAAGSSSSSSSTQTFGVTDSQQATAYTTWLNTGLASGVSGLMQYQWSQGNLTAVANSTIVPTSSDDNTAGESSNNNVAGESPNDGYGSQGVGQTSVQSILSSAVQSIGTL